MRGCRRLAVLLWLGAALAGAGSPAWAGGIDEIGYEAEMNACLDAADTSAGRRACIGLSARLCATAHGYETPDELCYRREGNYWSVRQARFANSARATLSKADFDASEVGRLKDAMDRTEAAWNELVGLACFFERDLTGAGMRHVARCVTELTAVQALRMEDTLAAMDHGLKVSGGE